MLMGRRGCRILHLVEAVHPLTILLAQNCLLFDAGVLLRQASSELKAALAEFADSLPALKEAQP